MTERGDKGGARARFPTLVRMTLALEEAAQAVTAIEDKYDLTQDQRKTLRSMLTTEVARRATEPELETVRLPDSAPELWANRKGRKENPVAFIRRVYAPWLNRGLKRGDLRSLDQQLYQALAVWMHRHPELKFAELNIDPAGWVERAKTRRPGLADAWARGRSTAKLDEPK